MAAPMTFLQRLAAGTGLSFLALIAGCTPSTIADVRSTIGEEYHVLKFPVMQHNIGSEWSKQLIT